MLLNNTEEITKKDIVSSAAAEVAFVDDKEVAEYSLKHGVPIV